MNKFIFITNQIFIWGISNILRIFYKIELIYHDFHLDKKYKYLIISNHLSKKDPFFICSFIPGKNKFLLLPYRFLTTDSYMLRLKYSFILRSFGAFRDFSSEKNRKRSLDLCQNIINNRQTLVLFPEGKINKKGKFDKNIKLGIGAVYLERNNPDLYIIPVKIEYLAKRNIKITYKKPFRHKKFPKNLYPLIHDTMNKIYD